MGGLFLSGPNIKTCTAMPRKKDMNIAAMNEGNAPKPLEAKLNRNGISIGPGRKSNHGKYMSPVSFMVTNVYAGYIARAPWSRFIRPDPL